MVVHEAEEDAKPDKSPNWAEKYLGSDHHTDRLMRTVIGLEDESCVRHHWYEDTKWPIYNKAQVEQSRRAASEALHVNEDQDDRDKSGDAVDDKSTFHFFSLIFFLHSLVRKNNKVGSVIVNIDWFLNFALFHFESNCPENLFQFMKGSLYYGIRFFRDCLPQIAQLFPVHLCYLKISWISNT